MELAVGVGLAVIVYVVYRLTIDDRAGPITLWQLLTDSRTETGQITPEDSDGTASVEGETAPLSDTIETPFSERDALAARWEVYEIEDRADRFRRIRRVDVEAGRETIPFVIDDGSGPILVDPENAAFVCATDSMPRSYGGDRNYEEFVVEPNQFAVVSGAVVPTAELDLNLDAADEELPATAIVSPDEERLTLADTDKYGLAYRIPRWHPTLTLSVLVALGLAVRFGPL